MKASLTQSHAHFSSERGFMAGVGQPKLCTKFEVPSFSHCLNIEVEPQILGSTPSQDHAHFFLWCDFMMGLSKPKLCTKFEVASFSHCVNIEGESQNFGELA